MSLINEGDKMTKTEHFKKTNKELIIEILQEIEKLRKAIEVIAWQFQGEQVYEKTQQKKKLKSLRNRLLDFDYARIEGKPKILVTKRPFNKKE